MRSTHALQALALAVAMLGCQPESEANTPGTTAAGPSRLTSDPGQELNPSLSPDGTAFAFDKLTSAGNRDIYLVRDGSPPVNLTADSPLADIQPAFSPDGSQIAFSSARGGGGIFVMNASGGPARRVSDEGFHPAWTPDGEEILYSTSSAAASPYGAPNNSVVRAVVVRTGQTRSVSRGYAIQPSVSPYGQRVAFWSLGDGAEGTERDIWTMRIDGTDVVRVTDDAAVDWNPIWGPTGDVLYFASDRDGSMKIWRIAIDREAGTPRGSPERVSTDDGAPVRGHLAMGPGERLAYVDATVRRSLYRSDFDPVSGVLLSQPSSIVGSELAVVEFAPSPDGRLVAFRTGDAQQEDLYVVGNDGSGLRRLTDDPYRDRVPSWTPDGTGVRFRSDRPAPGQATPSLYYQIHEMGADGTGLRRLTDLVQGGSPAAGLTSPDGSRIVFSLTHRTGGAQLYLMNADGSGLRQIGETTAAYGGIVWSPDSRRIAYAEVEGSGRAAYLMEVTDRASEPEPLPDMDFVPLSWSSDGSRIAGNRVFADRPVLTLVYDVVTGQFSEVTDEGGGAQWIGEGRRLLITREGASRIVMVDTETGELREIMSVAPPSTLAFELDRADRSLYWLRTDFEADVHRMVVSR